MPPSVSVCGFRDQPVWLMEDKPVRLLDDMRDVSTSVDIRELFDIRIIVRIRVGAQSHFLY